jgi:hypothetical protein
VSARPSNQTLTNAGLIGAGAGASSGYGGDAVSFVQGSDRLIVDPGALFDRLVAASGTGNTLELASAASVGALSGIGTSFTGFQTVTTDAGASWVVSGAVTGSGTIDIGAGSHLVLNGSVPASWPVDFTAATGILDLGDPAGFAATVFGFQLGDAIAFTSITSTGSITAGLVGLNELTLSSGGTVLAEIQLDPHQDFAGDVFHANPDGGEGTIVTLCFLAGTLIATPSGETPVEQLVAGEMVLTASGIVRPIEWIGAGRVLATRGQRTAATPVIVR